MAHETVKVFKSFSPIKTGYCLIYVFDICFTVIPNFTDIYWWKRYPNINFTINYVMITLLENRDIYSMI